MKQLLFSVFLCGLVASLTACKGDVACQSPPPVLRLLLTNADGSSAVDASDARQVAIRYVKNGQLTTLNDLQVRSAVESYDAIGIARQTADTTRFFISNGSRSLGTFQLKTYVDNSRCDGWTHISELRYNGKIIPYDNLKPGYTLVVP